MNLVAQSGWTTFFLTGLLIGVCCLLMLIILLQKGRGSGLAGAFGGGGGGSSAFGAKTGDVFTWITVTLAGVYVLLTVVANYAFDMSPVAVLPPSTSLIDISPTAPLDPATGLPIVDPAAVVPPVIDPATGLPVVDPAGADPADLLGLPTGAVPPAIIPDDGGVSPADPLIVPPAVPPTTAPPTDPTQPATGDKPKTIPPPKPATGNDNIS